MARRRYISTNISTDKQVNRLAEECGDFAALLYTWMIPHATDDGSITGDPDELLLVVIPGRRCKTVDDIIPALDGMVRNGLITWDKQDNKIYFPAGSFYKYQSYISEKNRRTPEEKTEQRKTPENTEERRTTAQNTVSPSPSPSPSPSLSPTPTPMVTSGGDGGAVDSQGGEVAELTRFIADEFIPGIGGYQLHKITAWVDEGMTPGVVRWAVEQAMMANVRRVDYVHAILKNLADEGITTREAAETAAVNRKRKPAKPAAIDPGPDRYYPPAPEPIVPVPVDPVAQAEFLAKITEIGRQKRAEAAAKKWRVPNADADSG